MMKINNWDDVARIFDERGYVTVSRYPDREIAHPRVWVRFYFCVENKAQGEELKKFFGKGLYQTRKFTLFDTKLSEGIIARISGKVVLKKEYIRKVLKKIEFRRRVV